MRGFLHYEPATPERVYLVRQLLDDGDIDEARDPVVLWTVFCATLDEEFRVDGDLLASPWHYLSQHTSRSRALQAITERNHDERASHEADIRARTAQAD